MKSSDDFKRVLLLHWKHLKSIGENCESGRGLCPKMDDQWLTEEEEEERLNIYFM